MGEERRDADMDLVGRSEGKRPSGRRRRRWEDKIKVDLQENGWGFIPGLNWLRMKAGDGCL